MNMTCKIAMDLAELYHEGLVSEESAHVIRVHLKECENCRKYYKESEHASQHRPFVRMQPAEDLSDTEARMYISLSRKLRRRRLFQIIGTSAAIGAGTIMLATGLIMLSKSAQPEQ